MKRKNLFYLVCLLFLSIAFGCEPKNNPVASYFQNADIQYETAGQRENIVAALNDIMTLPIEDLKNKRYKDYQGNEGQWDLQTLINKHFVPEKTKGLGDFYRYIKTKETQNEVCRILKRIQSEDTIQ